MLRNSFKNEQTGAMALYFLILFLQIALHEAITSKNARSPQSNIAIQNDNSWLVNENIVCAITPKIIVNAL